jgi:competence protein ComEC
MRFFANARSCSIVRLIMGRRTELKRRIVIFLCMAMIFPVLLTGCGKTAMPAASQSTVRASIPASPEPLRSDALPVQNGETVILSFIDVCRGDCILIQTPHGKTILIDAGNVGSKRTVVGYLESKAIKRIDVVVATHPHADHIGGMAAVIDRFEIGAIYMPEIASSSESYKQLMKAIKRKNIPVQAAKAGIIIDLDDALDIELLAPVGQAFGDLNDYSAVIRIAYRQDAFLFTGDAGKASEKEMLKANENVRADVLKVGHHGSNSATSAAFLKAVAPEIAVISVGAGNPYKLPSLTVLGRLNLAGIRIYRTDENGTVVITCDGRKISVHTGKLSMEMQRGIFGCADLMNARMPSEREIMGSAMPLFGRMTRLKNSCAVLENTLLEKHGKATVPPRHCTSPNSAGNRMAKSA